MIFVSAFGSGTSSPWISNKHHALQAISWHLLCVQGISWFILYSLVGTVCARTQSTRKQHNNDKMCTCFLFSKGTFPTISYRFFPTSTTQKREKNLSDAAWWFLHFETEGQRCEGSVQSFYLMHVGQYLICSSFGVGSEKGCWKTDLDSLAHTYICKSLIHNTFTQEESLFCNTTDS